MRCGVSRSSGDLKGRGGRWNSTLVKLIRYGEGWLSYMSVWGASIALLQWMLHSVNESKKTQGYVDS